MLAHNGGIITSKVLWLGGGTRRGDGRLARQEALAAVAAIVRPGGAGVNGAMLTETRKTARTALEEPLRQTTAGSYAVSTRTTTAGSAEVST